MNEQTHILIVDRDVFAADALDEVLGRHGYACKTTASAELALGVLEREQASADGPRTGVVVVDQDCAGEGAGIGLVRLLHDQWPDVVTVMVSGFRKVESAVQTMRLGAADYLLKPVAEHELIDAVQRAYQRHLLLAGQAVIEAPDEEDAAPPQGEVHQTFTDADHARDWTPMSLSEAMKEPEKQILLAALNANRWNRGETARQLEINRTTLYKKIRQYRLDEPA